LKIINFNNKALLTIFWQSQEAAMLDDFMYFLSKNLSVVVLCVGLLTLFMFRDFPQELAEILDSRRRKSNK